EFRLRYARMHFWPAVYCQPKKEPQKSQSANADKRAPPLPHGHNGRNNQWRQDRPDIRARIEYAGRKGALFLWEPFRYGLDARREYGRFPKAECNSTHAKRSERRPDRRAH